MKIGATDISKVYLGSTEVSKAYLGDTLMHGNLLPYDSELWYLKSSGTQYINTQIPVSDIRRYVTYMQIDALSAAQAEGSTQSQRYCFIGSNASNKYYSGVGNSTKASSIVNDQDFHTFELNLTTGEFLIDGVARSTYTAGAVTSDIKFTLMGCNGRSGTEGNVAYLVTCRKGETKIYGENDVLLGDFIPVRVGQVGYMYDKVSRQLFGNSGTGNFALSPDKNNAPYDAEVEYIQSSGTQYINTLVPINTIGKYVTYMQINNGSSARAEGSTHSNYDILYVGANSSDTFYAGLRSESKASNITNDALFHTFELNVKLKKYLIDNVEVAAFAGNELTSTINFCLMVCNGSGGVEGRVNYYITGKKGATKIYDMNDNLVRDYIPVRIGQIGYMYDKVSKELFKKSGTGTFSVGNDVNT